MAEYAYQKANGSIYLSDQRTEDYLTWGTGLNLVDGIYQFTIEMELSYYEGGNIGYITLTNKDATYLDTRILEETDFDRNGNAEIVIEMPVWNYIEPVVGIYSSGNGAMKINSISCVQVRGNLPIELLDEGGWKSLTEEMSELYRRNPADIWYVDTDGSAQEGFPDFTYVDHLLPEVVINYCTGK